MSKWIETVRGLENCLICGDLFDEEVRWSWMVGLGENRRICGTCAVNFLSIDKVSCDECGRPQLQENFYDENGEKQLCLDCIRWRETPPWNSQPFLHRSLYVYNSFMQNIIAQFKYRGDTELASLFDKKLVKLAKNLGKFHFAVPIPLNNIRHWERGFNQAEVLAQHFFTKKLLARSEENLEKQSKRSREERISALKNVFTFQGDKKDVSGKSILLIDDVYTTGATLRSAATVLYEHGAKHVVAVTVARSVGREARAKLS